ncbi:SDR family oxidoreductase [Actinomadura sp. LD22]|uniref:SDR family oxidoreductase n=1 Tax=Actinomadura physcomitrii TaxID=2650748 RepID=A0A6I4MG09_9ACTN|nr:SDR family oxidoreductase [Actinomadura physcomitrii]MWA03505.1 SDR family oxidoreductase [Actinomadura physcomitrii]
MPARVPDRRFEGRVAVVTGAAGGIGSGIVRRLAAEGARIVATDRADGLDETVAKEVGDGAGDWVTVAADLSSSEGAEQVVATAIDRFGRLDVLVNNAGGGIIKPFLDHTPETMRETVDRNLWTTVHCCRAALPHMVAAGYGRIVNVGADSVRNGLYEHAMYNAAKGGVHGLTTGLAREFAQAGITVNTVAPTGTDTPTVLSRPPDAVERYRKTAALIPIGRFATVEEVASAVAYLAAEEAGFVTGQVVSVNGGTAML